MKRVLIILIFACLSLLGLMVYQYLSFHDGKLHIVFCDVGQGDGILITTPNQKHILIDAGPDNQVVDCLARHLAFWERTIDLAFLTHPHADHFMGYYYLVDRYSLHQLLSENLVNKSDGFKQVTQLIQQRKINTKIVAKGDTWQVGNVEIRIAEPSEEFLVSENADHVITNSAESASLVVLIRYGDFSALLTGDAPVDEMEELAKVGVPGLDLLQIPHHGSSTGINATVLDLLKPGLAVISVGADNHYGHPTPQTLELLKQRGIKVLRTDQRGDIEILTDGQSFTVR